MKVWILFAATVAVLVLASGAVAFYTIQNRQAYSSPSCSALGIGWNSVRHDNGLTYLCGLGTVSDGRLAMTLHNYHFAQIGSNVFLLANLTFANIGRGNTSIANVLYANITNGAAFVGNGGGGANAEFLAYPNRTLPDTSGGAFLPPGKSITYWFSVYVPNTGTKDVPNLKLNDLSFLESIYGGIWEGGGGFRCPCGNPLMDLIVVTSASTPNTTLTTSPSTTTTTYTKSSTSFISQSTFTNSGQPLVEVTNTSLSSSIPATGKSNIASPARGRPRERTARLS